MIFFNTTQCYVQLLYLQYILEFLIYLSMLFLTTYFQTNYSILNWLQFVLI